MPKAIPKGGKRIIQVKVNFNEPEKECLDKLVEFYKSFDASSTPSSTLRKLLINWKNLEKYVVSFDEIRSKISDFCKNNKNKLSNDILEKLYSLIEIADALAEESNDVDKFTKRKVINNISENKSTEELIESNAKIVILKLFEVDEGNIIIDHLQEGNSVICDFSEFNFGENGISDEFSFLKGGIYGIKAKTEKISGDIFIFTPNKTEIENLSKKKSNSHSVNKLAAILSQKKGKEKNYPNQYNKQIPSLERCLLMTAEIDLDKDLNNDLDALRKFNKSNNSDLQNEKKLLEWALTKYERNLLDASLIDLDNAIKINPLYSKAYYWRGNAKQKLNLFEEALEDYDEAIKLEPKLALAYGNRASANSNLGRDEEAIKDCDEAIKLDPKLAYAYVNRASAKYNLSRYEETIKDCDEAIKLDPKLAIPFNNRGLAKSNLGRDEEAIKDYDEAIKLDPKLAVAYSNRGLANSNLGRHEEAIKDCDEAIKLDPKLDVAYSNRGLAKSNLGRDEDAINDYDEAIKLDPKLAVACGNRGIANSNLGRDEAAIKDYDEAIKLDSENAEVFYFRGLAKTNLGLDEEAIKDYDESIKLGSQDAKVFHNRGIAKSNLGRYEEAINDYGESIKLDSQDAMTFNSRGLANYNLGKYEEAIKDYNEAIKLNPVNSVVFYNRGVVKGSQDKIIEALKDFKKAAYHLKSKIKINPHKDDYKIIKQKVKNLLSKGN